MPSIYLLLCVVLLISIPPATAAPPRVHVRDFGARPDDGQDDTVAVAAAIAKAKEVGARAILFERGVYDFRAGANPASPQAALHLSGMKNITLDGRGAEFRIQGLTHVISAENVEGITVKNLTTDWDRPPFSVGLVMSAEEKSFDVQVEPEYPVAGGEPVGAFMEYDPQTRNPLHAGSESYYNVARTELVAPQRLRVHLIHPMRVKTGVLVVLRHQVYGWCSFLFQRCSNVRVENVTVHTTPGMGLVASNCRDVSVIRMRVVPRPGTRHPLTTTADATHFSGCKGTVTFRDCVFERMGDDGANVKSGLYLQVRQKVDAHTVLAQHNLKMVDMPDPGDILEISHAEDLLPFATVTVRRVTLEGPENMHRVEFNEPLPDGLRVGDVLGNATRVPRLRMKGCTVRLNRARGVLCQTRDAIIENCTFDRCTGSGILVLTEVVYFFESIGTRNVIVRNNRFLNCNYGVARSIAPVMAVAWLANSALPPKPGIHRDVRFVGNYIEGADAPGIFAAGVDGLIIEKNVFRNVCSAPDTPENGHAIRVMNSARIRIEGNDVKRELQGPGFRGEKLIEP